MKFATPLALCLIVCAAYSAQATDVFFMDSESVSEDGRYTVQAKSPANKDGNWKNPFARNFTYKLIEVNTAKTVWTRRQGESEGSCGKLYVANDGWVVIATGWNDLIFVDPKGHDAGTVGILKNALSEQERKKYVRFSTAGPMWAGYSVWYFVRQDRRRLFVIRPWWDRRMIFDIEKGEVVTEDTNIASACAVYEKSLVMRELNAAVKNRKSWDRKDSYKKAWPILKAAYLAGKLRIAETVPLLRQIQDSTYSGTSASSWSSYKPPEGEVDPSNWQEMTMRRVVHLSLRRLGVAPAQHACTEFKVHFEDYDSEYKFAVDPLALKRSDHASDVKNGMKPEQVLKTIGAPDFNEADSWHYDMDTDDPYTLIVNWGKEGVSEIEQKRPPLWQGETRDQEIAY